MINWQSRNHLCFVFQGLYNRATRAEPWKRLELACWAMNLVLEAK